MNPSQPVVIGFCHNVVQWLDVTIQNLFREESSNSNAEEMLARRMVRDV